MTEKDKLKRKPFVLIIRDGWGYNPQNDADSHNAIKVADTPVDDRLMKEYPNCIIDTSGEAVGLPDGTMGNSEVGHQNIGAGRVVYQDSVRITMAIRDGSFFENQALIKAVENAKQNSKKLHLMGLCSDIGVHSLLDHLFALLELAKKHNLREVYLHAFTDGRDSPPTSGKGYIQQIQKKMNELQTGKIASVMGRFYAMDRDNRWQRVQKAYDALTVADAPVAPSAQQAIEQSYKNDETDEFIKPILIAEDEKNPNALIEDGDSIIFFNFRGDRPREITRAFVDKDFQGFQRKKHPNVHFVCMTQYDKTINAPVAFPKPPKMQNIAGQYFSDLGLKQFRCAETEKYAHVTFFFNDGREEPFPGEQRQIIPSPSVETYDLKPEMSAYEVTEKVLEVIDSEEIDVVIMNFANPDMVGHTGNLDAAVKAAQTVDQCAGKIVDKTLQKNGALLICADHGNFEKMWDSQNNMEHTAHTIGTVPMIVVDNKLKNKKLKDGKLADIIPTLLDMMEIKKPSEMTGQSLIQ